MGPDRLRRKLLAGHDDQGHEVGRPDDRIGIGGPIEGLRRMHARILPPEGIFLGDGRINYREEKIIEAYCSYAINNWAWITADYQFIVNPATMQTAVQCRSTQRGSA